MSRILFLLGAVPFLFLGTAHALATPLRIDQSKGLSPRDAALRRTMIDATVLLTRRTNLWFAWVGFNLSHSLGAVLFGAAVVLVGRSDASYAAQADVFVPFAVLVAATYLAIGLRYWFRTPIAGIVVSLVCFVAAWFTLAGTIGSGPPPT